MSIMRFTYEAYFNLIQMLHEHRYNIVSYMDWYKYEKSVILRHDIDYNLDKAVEFAAFENSIGVSSTYFVQITSDMYNPFSKHGRECVKEIISLNHRIGLHFDEMIYESLDNVQKHIMNEKNMLESITNGVSVDTVSMHRPSRQILDANISLEGITNSYGELFFKSIKYISDSRRRWRESIEDIIVNESYDHMQILTHAFWYNNSEMDISDSIRQFVNSANKERYRFLSENITDLESIMREDEIR